MGLNYDAGLGSFTVKGGAAGWVSLSNGNFNIEGDAKACMLFGQLCLNGDALASKVGIEACATVIPPVNFGLFRTPSLRAGAAMRWGDSPSFMAPSCDIGGFRVDISTARRRARADGPVGTAVTVPTGAKIEVLRFNGDGKTTPRVRLYGPGGAVLDEQLPGQTLDFTKSFMIGDPQNHDVLAMLVQPAAGAWTAVALDNTTISSVDGAQDLPRPQVTGEVSQLPNGKQQLSYSFVPQDGLDVTFEEVGADQKSEQDLGRPAKACGNPCMGTITFSPALGYGGTRNVQASLTRNGLPLRPADLRELRRSRRQARQGLPPAPEAQEDRSGRLLEGRPARVQVRGGRDRGRQGGRGRCDGLPEDGSPQEPLRDVPRRQGRGAAAARVRHRS